MITVDYAPKGKDKPIQAANNKKPVTRRRKMKTVKIVLTAVVVFYSPVARCGVPAYKNLHRFRKVVQK